VIFWTNIASTMACPNFKNGPKNGLRYLGVNSVRTTLRVEGRYKREGKI
jgi:hypothetical protein